MPIAKPIFVGWLRPPVDADKGEETSVEAAIDEGVVGDVGAAV